jgi:hypothetical protein
MKIEDIGLIIIKDVTSNTYTAYPKNKSLTGMVVQCDKLEDIPKEMAKSYEVMLRAGFNEKGVHTLHRIEFKK